MILSYEAIVLFRKLGLIFIENFSKDQLGPNSYDVRLGNYFSHVSWFYDEPKFSEPMFFKDGSLVHIPNGGTLLGMTKERIGSRFCVVPEIKARSSTRRSGISICMDAGFGDIGYYDFNWTVELSGHTEKYKFSDVHSDPGLVVGERFAQIFFVLSTPTLHPYHGQYNQNDWPNNMIPKKYRNSK